MSVAAFGALYLAVWHLLGWQPVELPRALDPKEGGGALLVIVLLAGGYVVGAIVVQATFDWPAARFRQAAEERYLRTLAEIEEILLDSPDGPSAALWQVAFRSAGVSSLPGSRAPAELRAVPGVDTHSVVPAPANRIETVIDETLRAHQPQSGSDVDTAAVRAARTLLCHLGRLAATPDLVARDVEYRRSIRQVFLSVVPSLIAGTLAGIIAAWSSKPDGWVLIIVGLATLGSLGARKLWTGAKYQERVATELLLTSVFASRWHLLDGDPDKREAEAGEAVHATG